MTHQQRLLNPTSRDLFISDIRWSDDGKTLEFVNNGKKYEFDLKTRKKRSHKRKWKPLPRDSGDDSREPSRWETARFPILAEADSS